MNKKPPLKCIAKLSDDRFLTPFWGKIEQRRKSYIKKYAELTCNRQITLPDFASGHEYYGFHQKDGQWIFREWAPNAEEVFLVGDFSNWRLDAAFKLQKINLNGDWEVTIPKTVLKHGMHCQLRFKINGEFQSRLPSYSRFVVQNEETKIFSTQIYAPEQPYVFKYDLTSQPPDNPLIYEAHIGMAQNEEKVGTFKEFQDKILPRIAKSNYNTIQLMAVMSHPYYGSFGYHVANFFSISSRFGTPDEFKALIDAAHKLNLRVIIDLVHSHAVKNEVEGLAKFDGTVHQYFHAGPRGEHTAWDSLCFNYGKNEVLHFLLSNCRFYLDEYHVDGFRFDGVTSMLYLHHGLNKVFTSYDDYFSPEVDESALTYLTLANQLIHQVKPSAITVAEDVSGMIGVAAPFENYGIGFDYRLAMGVSDMWFKLFDLPDDTWNMYYMFYELTNCRNDEKVISYVECHDQAIVGGQTAIFRLIGSEMYFAMSKLQQNLKVDRGIALHKLIRLATLSCADSGYLNFMGNEFGHPEWIDFPREGNNWSYKYARRQWNLCEDTTLHYHSLNCFDAAMLKLFKNYEILKYKLQRLKVDNNDKIIAFERGNFWFFFNFHPEKSYADYGFNVLKGDYELILSSDEAVFSGFDRVKTPQLYSTKEIVSGAEVSNLLQIYLPCRSALVLQKTK